MSAADMEVVHRSFRAWSEADFEALKDFYTEDVVFHSAVMDLVGRTVVGREALREFLALAHDDWEVVRWEVDEVFEAERGIVSLHRVIGTGRASGLEMTRELAGLYEMRDGRIAREWIYTDREEALRAAGERTAP